MPLSGGLNECLVLLEPSLELLQRPPASCFETGRYPGAPKNTPVPTYFLFQKLYGWSPAKTTTKRFPVPLFEVSPGTRSPPGQITRRWAFTPGTAKWALWRGPVVEGVRFLLCDVV